MTMGQDRRTTMDETHSRDYVKRKSDMGSWVQSAIAIVGLTAAFFAWYTNQSSRANAEEVLKEYSIAESGTHSDHNDRGDSHYGYRSGVSEQLQEQREAIIEMNGVVGRIEDAIKVNKGVAGEIKTDQRAMRITQDEILRLLQAQAL